MMVLIHSQLKFPWNLRLKSRIYKDKFRWSVKSVFQKRFQWFFHQTFDRCKCDQRIHLWRNFSSHLCWFSSIIKGISSVDLWVWSRNVECKSSLMFNSHMVAVDVISNHHQLKSMRFTQWVNEWSESITLQSKNLM